MTLYRITIDLSFNDEDPVNDIWDKAADYIAQSCTIRPGEPNEERGFIQKIVCGHADDPNDPCLPGERIESPLTPCEGNLPPKD